LYERKGSTAAVSRVRELLGEATAVG
jgi:hypothetical protein